VAHFEFLSEGGKSGMNNFPGWLELPWLVAFLFLMIWAPKTKKGWYLAGFILACQTAVLLYIHFSK